VIKYWSVGVLRQVPIPSALPVEDAEGAGDDGPAHDLTEFVGVDAPPPITLHLSPVTFPARSAMMSRSGLGHLK